MKLQVFDFVTFLHHSIEPVVSSLLRGAVVGNCPSHLRHISVAFLLFHFTDLGVTSLAGIVAGVIAHSTSVTSPTTSERVRFPQVVTLLVPGLLWAITTKMPYFLTIITGYFPHGEPVSAALSAWCRSASLSGELAPFFSVVGVGLFRSCYSCTDSAWRRVHGVGVASVKAGLADSWSPIKLGSWSCWYALVEVSNASGLCMDPLPLAFQCTRLPLVVILWIVQVIYFLIELGGEARCE